MVVLGIIGTWINGIVVDFYTASLNRKKRVCLISDRHEEIRDYIINTLNRGCSLYTLKGGYSGEEKVEILTLLTTNEFSSLMGFLKNRQIDYFLTAGNVSEVYGRWNASGKHRKTAEKDRWMGDSQKSSPKSASSE